MKNLFIILAGIFSISGCKTPCDNPASPVYQLEKGMESQWDCKNHAALEKDVNKWFADKGMCELKPNPDVEAPKGPIANLICPLAGMALQNYLGGKVSPEWQCDESKVGKDAVTGLVALCELIPYSPQPKGN